MADGAVNCNFLCDIDMRLSEAPVRLEIRDSELVHFSCDRKPMRDLLQRAFSVMNGRRVGELGFGTNRTLPGFVSANSHLNERHPGIHLGFGQHNQTPSRVPYDALTHVDMVTNSGSVIVDEIATDLRTIEPDPAAAHPALVRDEDVTGDCCSAGCAVASLRGG